MTDQPTILNEHCIQQWKSYESYLLVPEEVRATARQICIEQGVCGGPSGGDAPDLMIARYFVDGRPSDMVPQWWYSVGQACMRLTSRR